MGAREASATDGGVRCGGGDGMRRCGPGEWHGRAGVDDDGGAADRRVDRKVEDETVRYI